MLPPRTSEYLKQSQSEYKIYYFTRTKSYQTKKVVTKLFKFLGWLYILIVIIANLDNNNFFHQYSTVEFPSLCSWRTNRDHRWKSRELNLKSRFWIKQKMYPYQYIIRFGVLLSTLLEISFPILTFHFVCPSQKTLSQRSIFNIMTSILNFLIHFISKTQFFFRNTQQQVKELSVGETCSPVSICWGFCRNWPSGNTPGLWYVRESKKNWNSKLNENLSVYSKFDNN